MVHIKRLVLILILALVLAIPAAATNITYGKTITYGGAWYSSRYPITLNNFIDENYGTYPAGNGNSLPQTSPEL